MAKHNYSLLVSLGLLAYLIVGVIRGCNAREEEENSAYHESVPRVTTSEEKRIDTEGTFNSIPTSEFERVGKEDHELRLVGSDESGPVHLLQTKRKAGNKIGETGFNLMSAVNSKLYKNKKVA